MEVESENITRNNIKQYLGFIRNQDKEGEEEEKGNMDKRLVKVDTKRKHKTFRCLPLFPLRKRDWNLFIFLLT